MSTNSNPEEIESNPSFISKSIRNKLKPVSPKEISHYSISNSIYNSG